ncbi:hypothetical protein HDU91_001510 [Kappamyces sp. JEL0680]|nr:hypothetical protein HDU91_001510 [Kappamyces sp. JEL0680]
MKPLNFKFDSKDAGLLNVGGKMNFEEFLELLSLRAQDEIDQAELLVNLEAEKNINSIISNLNANSSETMNALLDIRARYDSKHLDVHNMKMKRLEHFTAPDDTNHKVRKTNGMHRTGPLYGDSASKDTALMSDELYTEDSILFIEDAIAKLQLMLVNYTNFLFKLKNGLKLNKLQLNALNCYLEQFDGIADMHSIIDTLETQ